MINIKKGERNGEKGEKEREKDSIPNLKVTSVLSLVSYLFFLPLFRASCLAFSLFPYFSLVSPLPVELTGMILHY